MSLDLRAVGAKRVLITLFVLSVLHVRCRGFWQEVQVELALTPVRHTARGGRIKCVQPDCDAMYAEPALARILPDELFREYRAAQVAVVEQRLFE